MELADRVRAAYARRPTKRRIGTTPIDIEILLRDDADDPYFAQLHYMHQYDGRGYPEMRREVVDYLEASLEETKTRAHLREMCRLAAIVAAMDWLSFRHPDTWRIYAAIVLDGKSALTVADEEIMRVPRVLRVLDHGRRVVRAAYDRYLLGQQR